MSSLFLVLCAALLATAWVDGLDYYTTLQDNSDLKNSITSVANALAGQSGKSARATFIQDSISKITTEFIPAFTNSDPSRPSNGPYYVVVYNTGIGINKYSTSDLQLYGGWYDLSDVPGSCTPELKNAEGKCIQRDPPQTASVQFDGATYTAITFSNGFFNKCGKAGGSDNWGFTFDGPFPPSATDTNCTSGPSSATAVPCTATNRCYITWPCKKYCSNCAYSCCCAAGPG